MSLNESKKRQHSSTASELDISVNSDNHPLYPVLKQKDKKKKNKKSKHEFHQIEDNTISGKRSTMESCNETTSDLSYGSKLEKQLAEISSKLTTLLSKDDTTFIKNIIEDKMNEMKDSFLSSMTKRVEVLENDVYSQAQMIQKLEQEIKTRDKVINELKNKDNSLNERLKKDELCCEKFENESEQYSRRNNVRIYGIKGDVKNQTSESVMSKVIQTINEKTDLVLQETDIDITHRLGQYKVGKHRPIIVKFVRRQTKINLFKTSKKLRECEIFVNEDLTKLNADLLASCRVKDKSKVEKAWSFEGKIYVKYISETFSTQIQFKDYRFWLDLPWPEKTQASGKNPAQTNKPVRTYATVAK